MQAIRALRERALDIVSLQEIHAAAAQVASEPPAARFRHDEAALPRALGGGAHAAAHAGVLRALDRDGIAVAGIAGVSGGALVAAAWAGGADLERLVDQASRLHPWMWVRGWGGGLLSGTKLGMLIDEFLPVARPSRACASRWWSSPPTWTPASRWSSARATCATPCAPPAASPASSRRWSLNGRRLYDGGVSEVIPVRLAREMAGEAGVVVAVDCNSGTRWPAADSFVALALRAGLTLLRGRSRGELAGADLVIAPADGRVGLDAAAEDPALLRGGRRGADGGAAGAATGPGGLMRGLPERRRAPEAK